jgi:pyrroline-5-carboxylate reductase
MDRDAGKIGFIGAGNMATALIKGLIKSGLYEPERILAADNDPEKLGKISKEFGVSGYGSNRDLVKESGVVVLSVKPQVIRGVLEEAGEVFREDHLVVSIAAGIPLRMIQGILKKDVPLIRVMPNTPALIQQGMSAIAPGKNATGEHLEAVRAIFKAVGKAVIVSEEMMDAVTAVSGSGPGFVFRIMECFVEAGIDLGFDSDTALELVLQTMLGAARVASESDKSLSQLREMVTSPGGTTAAGLAVFEKIGLEEMIKAVLKAACDRSHELGKNY